MNSLLNKNLELLQKRFADLYAELVTLKEVLGCEINQIEIAGLEKICGVTVSQSKTGLPVAVFNQKPLHSAYDPQKEAARLINDENIRQKDAAVFMGFGLGYGAIEFAKTFQNKSLVLIECDPMRLLLALSLADWTPVFEQNSCVLLLAAPQQSVIAILERIGIENCHFILNKNQIAHNAQYFNALQELIQRNKQKKEINQATLDKFSLLWLRNMCRNLPAAKKLDGVSKFFGKFASLDACVIAAGPSLDQFLPVLPQIHRRCLTVCVDTALKACLKAGVEPDFIVVCDPQYWNLRHLDNLKAPGSVLITELASFPPVFRFECKEIVLCSSLYPLGKFIEKRTENRGELGAGGSVVTTAWDFARLCGCKNIFMAGLDLSFPQNKTHFKGSTFEERSHRLSSRLKPAETDAFNALYGAFPYYADDNAGGKVLSDQRMALYAWWFESKCAEFGKTCTTFNMQKYGIKIPGMPYAPAEEILARPETLKEKQAVKLSIEKSESEKIAQIEERSKNFDRAINEAAQMLKSILVNAQNARTICSDALAGKMRGDLAAQKLAQIDQNILKNQAAELASLVFPTEKKLEKLCANARNPLEKSKIIYEEIIRSVKTHLQFLGA